MSFTRSSRCPASGRRRSQRETSMTAQIRKSTNGQYFVRVVASNGQTLAHSETYTTKASAQNCAKIIANGGTVQDWT